MEATQLARVQVIVVVSLEEPGFCQLPVISRHFARNAKTIPSKMPMPSFMPSKMPMPSTMPSKMPMPSTMLSCQFLCLV